MQNGQQVGPFPLNQMWQRVASGKLGGDDLVWVEGTPAWVAAREVALLFPNGATTPVAGPPMAPAPRGQAGTTAFGRILDRVENLLLLLVWLYFTASWAVATTAIGHLHQAERGDAAAAESSDALFSFYQAVFEPVNRPVRPYLPKEGRYHVIEADNRSYYLDVAPIVAAFILSLVLVLVFAVLRMVLRVSANPAR
jgi:hypothetical protein